MEDKTQFLSQLVEKGVDLNEPHCGKFGFTLLSRTVQYNRFSDFCALVDVGVDINLKRIHVNGEREYMLESLLKARTYDSKYIQYLLNHGGKVYDPCACFSIHRFIAMDEFSIVKALVENCGLGPSVLNTYMSD